MRLWNSKLTKIGIVNGIDEVVGGAYDKRSIYSNIAYSLYVLNCTDTHTILTNYPEILDNYICNRLPELLMDATTKGIYFVKVSIYGMEIM